jgi:formyltetrahydrofolate-dependent phosphoribosylglycinamide formyltransferase
MVEGRSTTATVQRMKAGESTGAASAPSSNKLRLGVLGSGQGTNFDAILSAIGDKRLDAEISVVLSDVADSPIMRKAQAAGLPAIHVHPGDLPRRFSANAQKEVCDHLKRHGVQVVVLTGFMRVLKEPVLSEFRDRIVNVHPSLLPAFAGIGAIEQALAYGVKVMGVTVHLVDEGVDSGPVVLQESFALVPYPRGIAEVEERVHEVEHRLLPRAVKLIAEGRVHPDPDNPRLLRIEDGERD